MDIGLGRSTMNVALWIVQGLLAALFLFAGGAKLVRPLDQFGATGKQKEGREQPLNDPQRYVHRRSLAPDIHVSPHLFYLCRLLFKAYPAESGASESPRSAPRLHAAPRCLYARSGSPR